MVSGEQMAASHSVHRDHFCARLVPSGRSKLHVPSSPRYKSAFSPRIVLLSILANTLFSFRPVRLSVPQSKLFAMTSARFPTVLGYPSTPPSTWVRNGRQSNCHHTPVRNPRSWRPSCKKPPNKRLVFQGRLQLEN